MKKAAILYCAILVLAGAALFASGGEPGAVPEEALDALRFFVGTWEGETFEDGVKIGTDHDERQWSSGRHCVTMEGSGVETGVRVHFCGISGWDARAEQLVEHWYGSDGLYVAVRYPLRSMTEEKWRGTTQVIFSDGTQIDGDCELQKTHDGFVWTARWQRDGKAHVRKSVARRVNSKER